MSERVRGVCMYVCVSVCVYVCVRDKIERQITRIIHFKIYIERQPPMYRFPASSDGLLPL